MRLIKLHTGLINYLRTELKNKRSFKKWILFFKELSKVYFRELIKLYKELFIQLDPQYQKQKAEFKKYQQYKKDIQNAYKIIQWMIKQGENRTERKHIRRDFEKHGRLNKETEKAILKDIYGVK